jgi:predicted regulator of Ras-like GTPase activity (Roadblock/LC7/MglB family)
MQVVDSSQAVIALRDVDGVIGSFLVDAGGQLIVKDLPAVFDASLFESIGPRLLRLGEVLGQEGEPPDTISMRFSEHRLYLKFLKRGAVLTVLSSLGVNPSTLKMAVTLTARRIEQALPTVVPASRAGVELQPPMSRERETPDRISRPPDTQPSPLVAAPPTSVEVPDVVKAKARVMYRGRPI